MTAHCCPGEIAVKHASEAYTIQVAGAQGRLDLEETR